MTVRRPSIGDFTASRASIHRNPGPTFESEFLRQVPVRPSERQSQTVLALEQVILEMADRRAMSGSQEDTNAS